MKKGTITVACSAAALFLSAASASADSSVMPGQMCVELNESATEIVYTHNGAFNSNETYGADFLCPIVRSLTDDSDYASSIVVNVSDNHSDKAVECKWYSRPASGGAGYYGDAKASTAGADTLDLGSLSASSSFSKGFYYVYCNVPDATGAGRSGVNSVYINEI